MCITYSPLTEKAGDRRRVTHRGAPALHELPEEARRLGTAQSIESAVGICAFSFHPPPRVPIPALSLITC
jgi:hypothetical protein